MRLLISLPLFLLTPLQAVGQQAELVCISVGDASRYAVILMYGSDGTMVAMQIPPEGVPELAEATILQQEPEVFAALVDVLRPGLEALPPPPEATACESDQLGPVAIGVQLQDGPALTYQALCPTPELLDLNTRMIGATGDPLGEEIASWTATAIPTHRDMCRDLL